MVEAFRFYQLDVITSDTDGADFHLDPEGVPPGAAWVSYDNLVVAAPKALGIRLPIRNYQKSRSGS